VSDSFDLEPVAQTRPQGRPFATLDRDVIERAASIGCTMAEIAAVCRVSMATLYNHIELHPEIRDIIERGRAAGKATLRRLQWQRANNGSDTMLIWLGKQLLGQKDRQELSADPSSPPLAAIQINFVEATDGRRSEGRD
jgi:hypothetical protein